MKVSVVIPALNEETALPIVLAELKATAAQLPSQAGCELHDIIVADNGSSDRTAQRALEAGARVVDAAPRGYGAACQAGLAALSPDCEAVVFLDGDHSDFVEELPRLLRPIAEDRADLVLGHRRPVEGGALTPVQRFGNRLACLLMRILYGHSFSDLGPFRAIRRQALESLKMEDVGFAWTIEMQIKAAQNGLRIVEVPVRYRARVGQSKVSGTVLGSWRAGRAILGAIARYAGHA